MTQEELMRHLEATAYMTTNMKRAEALGIAIDQLRWRVASEELPDFIGQEVMVRSYYKSNPDKIYYRGVKWVHANKLFDHAWFAVLPSIHVTHWRPISTP